MVEAQKLENRWICPNSSVRGWSYNKFEIIYQKTFKKIKQISPIKNLIFSRKRVAYF